MDLTILMYAGATLATALVAGVFLAFSDFIMRSLNAASPAAGLQSMQIINREVFSSVFMVLLLGLVPVSVGLCAYALAYVDGPAKGWFVAGGALYFLGTFLVTMFGNVPMNQRLDPLMPEGSETQDYWRVYGSVWTRWNHVRTVASAAASAAFLMGCLLYV